MIRGLVDGLHSAVGGGSVRNMLELIGSCCSWRLTDQLSTEPGLMYLRCGWLTGSDHGEEALFY